MTVRRMSVSFPEEVEAAVRVAAATAGVSVSRWLTEVAATAAVLEDGRRAVREYEDEHAPLDDDVRAQARLALDGLGVGGVRPDVAAS